MSHSSDLIHVLVAVVALIRIVTSTYCKKHCRYREEWLKVWLEFGCGCGRDCCWPLCCTVEKLPELKNLHFLNVCNHGAVVAITACAAMQMVVAVIGFVVTKAMVRKY